MHSWSGETKWTGLWIAPVNETCSVNSATVTVLQGRNIASLKEIPPPRGGKWGPGRQWSRPVPLHSRLAGSALVSNSCCLLLLPLPQYRELTMTGQNGYFTVRSHGTEILSWPLTCRYFRQWKNMVDSRFALLWVFNLFLVWGEHFRKLKGEYHMAVTFSHELFSQCWGLNADPTSA